ncbi:7-carboxy-7-deazaguanine synthase QueE [Calderihabitans maritimus]|uniref:7-carboxy-7-deazaguanine synthase n=1 Tax=Calderihabitans maritimus TaxID=1246530 RepID=A0A1Z5HXH6_9FIRM|nr:7-carboxy-7-deazaguanine synthase QueE [Calderihabitans maritimus]GAW94236.1 hypothetical protein KKC1_33470 [Calderihabitans maritimus]
MRSPISEVFSSIQGEGLYVGRRQIFIRFAGCNLSCAYCDTIESRSGKVKYCNIEVKPGSAQYRQLPNPLSVEDLLDNIVDLLEFPHHSVSLTGGEPLLYHHFVRETGKRLKEKEQLIYLETNGTLPDRLAEVLPYVDIVSMDVKLPTHTGKSYWAEHKEFLNIARRKEVFVKIVVSASSPVEEIREAINLVAGVDYNIPLVLQPVTPVREEMDRCPGKWLMYLQDMALEKLAQVSVIPQTHRLVGVK